MHSNAQYHRRKKIIKYWYWKCISIDIKFQSNQFLLHIEVKPNRTRANNCKSLQPLHRLSLYIYTYFLSQLWIFCLFFFCVVYFIQCKVFEILSNQIRPMHLHCDMARTDPKNRNIVNKEISKKVTAASYRFNGMNWGKKIAI